MLKVEAQHACHGVEFEVATNYARASTFIKGHEGEGPYPVQVIGVSMLYDGHVQIGTHDQPDHVETGNPDAPGEADSWSTFPYGSNIHQHEQNTAFAEVSDQNRTLLIDVCGGLTARDVAHTYGGAVYHADAHSH